jgi:hypothetical protein
MAIHVNIRLAHFLLKLSPGTRLGRCRLQGENSMTYAARTRWDEPLPLNTAILSNIALSLLMWNIALRVADLLLAA